MTSKCKHKCKCKCFFCKFASEFETEDVCPYCRETKNSEKGCEECSIFNFKKQQKGCGQDCMKCGIHLTCPACSNQSPERVRTESLSNSGVSPVSGPQSPQVKPLKGHISDRDGLADSPVDKDKTEIELKDIEQGTIRLHLHTKKSILELINQIFGEKLT